MKYKWFSKLTGEIVSTLPQVVKVVLQDFKNYKVLNVRWIYNKKGW